MRKANQVKYAGKIEGTKLIFAGAAFLLVISSLVACDNDSNNRSKNSGGAGSEKGAISYNLAWEDDRPASLSATLVLHSGEACVDYGIELIAADVFDPTNTVVASDSWPCPDHEGIVDEVPAGEGYSLIVEGIVNSGDIDWRGEVPGIEVTEGETTDAGTVIMLYVGDDDTSPQIISTDPVDSRICVPTDAVITATFSEKMISSTVNESTFTLESGTGPISGIVAYEPSTQTASFTPDTFLSFAEDYTATISKEVKDMAGNNLEDDFSWSFTTVYAGDYDLDCDVDGKDLHTFSSAYAAESPAADLNDDGEVNAQDLQIFSMNYGFFADAGI